ncbi:MAG: PD-(D/E)XK nuclease family protein, partial [Firmicutes bacterium]|nr:PD-(D/E)XK nuclease family protein [Bacillota bacterium]
RRYRLLHVERREEPPSVASFVGTVVHQALKSFFRLKPADRSWEALERTLRRAWAAAAREEVFASREEEASAGRQALADLKAFYTAADRRVVPFELEVFLSTQLGEGVTVRGKVDRIDRVPGKEGLVLIDYKTGRVPVQKPNLIDEFQLPLYQAMVTEAYSRPVEKVVLLYIKGNTQFEFRLQAPDIDRAKAHALDLARRIAADNEFAARPGPLCRFCSFLADCPGRADIEARYIREAKEPDPDLTFVMRDLNAVLSAKAKIAGTLSMAQVVAAVQEVAGRSSPVFQGIAHLTAAGTRLAYAAEGNPDPYAGFEARIVPENVTLLPKTNTQASVGPNANERVIAVKKGDSAASILRDLGASTADIEAIVNVLGPRGRDGGLREGQKLR